MRAAAAESLYLDNCYQSLIVPLWSVNVASNWCEWPAAYERGATLHLVLQVNPKSNTV